ncbi:hypothetical protein COHA_010097 [Chlorella ohadii]|uniref:Serine aminopeptidase S33 domain-containing protein n=1 Tax=Chlorella ohadii TaxID=2649997 RepID=A0AAD5GZZ1_9CHLO|nr:hypothetical protein COHA_010097 [Chlorella ohadii]
MAAAPAEAPAAAAAAEERELDFLNPKGERLFGKLVDTGSDDVVILCHGYVANSEMCQFPLVAAELAEAGLSSFRFDHACAIRSRSERQGPFLMGNHEDEARMRAALIADMAAAVAFMRSIGKRVVCLLGHSKGGINAVMFAARHHDVPKVINLAGRFRTREGTLQRFGADILERLARDKAIPRREPWGEWVMTEEDFLNRCNLPMEEMARSVPPTVCMLCLHGTADTTIPYADSELCASLVPNSRLILVEGADHNFTGEAAGQAMARHVVNFVLS